MHILRSTQVITKVKNTLMFHIKFSKRVFTRYLQNEVFLEHLKNAWRPNLKHIISKVKDKKKDIKIKI